MTGEDEDNKRENILEGEIYLRLREMVKNNIKE